MKKTKILSKICSSLLVIGIMSTSVPVHASEINTTDLQKVKQEYNLKTVTEVPENAIVYKFDTPEQADNFLNVLEENEAKSTLDLSTIASDDEIKSGIVDLSEKEITKSNFKKDKDIVIEKKSSHDTNANENAPIRNISIADYTTVEHGSICIGFCNVNIDASVKVKWKSSVGNYYADVKDVSSYLTGVYYGNAWTQSTYSDNIVDNGKKLKVKVRGKFDYYILINTSMTSFAGQTKSYSTSWTLD